MSHPRFDRPVSRLRDATRAGRVRNACAPCGPALAIALAALITITAPLSASEPSAGPARGPAIIVPIRGVIDDILAATVARRVDAALAEGVKTIIFEMDTPGGAVTSALGICRSIKSVPADVRTVAWVHHQALSAGAMISVTCREIWMSSASSIGDCAPILLNPAGGLQELPATERAKAESPVLQEFRDSAARNGYDPLLLRAMVTLGEEVWWIENVESRAREFVNADEKRSRIDDADGEKQWKLVESYVDPISKTEVKAVQPIDSKEALLTLSQSEAVAYGLARGLAADAVELAGGLGLSGPPPVRDVTSWEKFVLWLNSPLIRGILLAIAVIGGYIEFNHPGLILPGITALVALVVFVGAPYAAGLANFWPAVLLIVGVALVLVEVFVLPGFGVAGVLGGLAVLVALVGTFVPRLPDAPLFTLPDRETLWTSIRTGVIVVTSSLMAAVAGILFLMRYLPHLPVARRLVLENPDASGAALLDPFDGVAQVGDVGVVISPLRSGGKVRFGQEVVEAASQGEYVEVGTKVQVIKRVGAQIVVRPLAQD
ncbi:MAG: nodulation protein NfeD [Phycisphaerae bacterium]